MEILRCAQDDMAGDGRDISTTLGRNHMQATHPEVVVITGASAGVGRAIARAFARRGAHIGLLARGHEGLEAARHDVEQLGGKALAIPTGVADPDHAIMRFTGSIRCELIHDRSNVKTTMVQPPAVNTPQSGWVKSRLPRKAQPVLRRML
jgi:predicted amino acid dehydrogenase